MATDQEIAFRANIVLATLAWCGTPYCHQASTKQQGTDCLGLVRGVWREVIGTEPMSPPPYAASWAADDRSLIDAAARFLHRQTKTEPQPGDVLLFQMRPHAAPRHCGIYIGMGRFVHAYDGRAVGGAWYSSFWQKRCTDYFSFPMTYAEGNA